MSEHEMISKIKLLREYEQMASEAQAEADALKDELKAYMGEREELAAGDYRIAWKSITSTRIDAAALRASLPDIAARYTRQSTARRFTVAIA